MAIFAIFLVNTLSFRIKEILKDQILKSNYYL